MAKAYVFPGQGAQFVGMGKDLYESKPKAKELFDKANVILGYRITDIMFEGTDEDLKQTKVTQPAVFLHSVITALCMDDFKPDMVAGHSLGEFSALTAAGALSFEDGLKLVYARAMAMQKACEAAPSTMAAIIGLPDETIEQVCTEISKEGNVVQVNCNTIGATDNLRNLILVCTGNQRALRGGRNGIAPNIVIDDITKAMHVNVLTINHLTRIISGTSRLGTENAVLKHGHSQVVLVCRTIGRVIHLNSNRGNTGFWINYHHTSDITLRSLVQLLVGEVIPSRAALSGRSRTIDDS